MASGARENHAQLSATHAWHTSDTHSTRRSAPRPNPLQGEFHAENSRQQGLHGATEQHTVCAVFFGGHCLPPCGGCCSCPTSLSPSIAHQTSSSLASSERQSPPRIAHAHCLAPPSLIHSIHAAHRMQQTHTVGTHEGPRSAPQVREKTGKETNHTHGRENDEQCPPQTSRHWTSSQQPSEWRHTHAGNMHGFVHITAMRARMRHSRRTGKCCSSVAHCRNLFFRTMSHTRAQQETVPACA